MTTLFDLDIEAATEIYRRMQADGREEDSARFNRDHRGPWKRRLVA